LKPASRLHLIVILVVCLALLFTRPGQAMDQSQIEENEQAAQELLALMQPEERVGQLFLVSFNGPEAAPGTEEGQKIYDLIVNYHIGGVVLSSENDNFVSSGQTIPILMSLTDQLQRNEYSGSLLELTPRVGGSTYRPAFIPLLIGLSQDGDGYPYDQILNGVSTLPNLMTLGATWQPDLARQVGETLGQELNILGINLVFGPSLDVLEPKYYGASNNLGVTTFGSDPFWVGEMAKAYITGLHQGSDNEMVVVGKHFPGFGGADRLPEDEVATVRKTLEQLKQFELYPFFAATGLAPSPEATLDGLLTAHIRYQGLQENFRQTTKPISFDAQAFANLMGLPALNSWRQNGGIMVSDSLGSRAVRRFYDPTGQAFNARTVALDAFLAGNDILYLDNFISTGDEDSYTTITRVVDFFTQKYREDPAFAQRVDQSVLRILKMKLRLYDNRFFLNKVQPDPGRRGLLGFNSELTFKVAREAATIISPPLSELDNTIPQLNEQIVIISDVRSYQQCSTCVTQNSISVNALEQAITRLYSPEAGGQVLPRDITSYSYQDLYNLLQSGVGETEIELALRQAEWVVFIAVDVNASDSVTLSLQRFLDERPDLYQGKHLIVFALNVPYILDATEIAKLSTMYALYSRSTEFIEMAARLLFQEVQPLGNLPVTVPGIGYDINRMTFPDPNQVIPIFLEDESEVDNSLTPTPEATSVVHTYRLGDLVNVRTGIIMDHNGHSVPDGTIVRFILTQGGDLAGVRQVESLTSQGVARASLRVEIPGNLSIRVESEEARSSEVIQINVPMEGTPETPIPSPTITLTFTPEPTSSPTPSPTPEPTPELQLIEPVNVGFSHWVIGLAMILVFCALSFSIGQPKRSLRWRVRTGLLVAIGGIIGYTYLALEFPGATILLTRTNVWSAAIMAALGACLGWLATLVWKNL
jgi:beta-N-acetylhexosaminidase